MKKLLICLLALLVAVPAGSAQPRQRDKLTLMIYMCGSDLESRYGSASTDIREMIASGCDFSGVNVLIMTGGSQSWRLGFSPDQLTISQLINRGGGRRILEQQDSDSMGARLTLKRLLDFGVKHFPAEKYALILWDHGGGPLEGICRDELYAPDRLNLSELTDALKESDLPGRLSWIGFDACLMGSAEVAAALAPYAEFMIASQELEPASGWNYAFLNGIEDDTDGAATGRRIVDRYFEGQGDSLDRLTLSCVDLSAIGALTDAMDAYFGALASSLSADTFAEFSARRMSAAGFGKAVDSAGAAGYDLVDLTGLIREGGGPGAAELLAALDAAVVYRRANEEGAGGLSVYHPFANKGGYRQGWAEDYDRLGFSDGYRRYVRRFSELLLGEALVDWSEMRIAEVVPTEDGGQLVSMRLDEDQLASLASAQLVVLEHSATWGNAYYMVDRSQVHPDEEGWLRAEYGGRALYAVDGDENPQVGPLNYALSDDGELYSIETVYSDDSNRRDALDYSRVLYQCRIADDPDALQIAHRFVYDATSDIYTSRIPFTEDGYTQVHFPFDTRRLPAASGSLPPFDAWEDSDTSIGTLVDLPCDWSLRFFNKPLTGGTFYAAYEIVDAQNNVRMTPLEPLGNPNVTDLEIRSPEAQARGLRLRLTAERNASALFSDVTFTLSVDNPTDREMVLSANDLVLNGRRIAVGNSLYLAIPPGGSDSSSESLSGATLYGLDAIETVGFTAQIHPEGDYDDVVEVPLSFELLGCDLAGIAPAMPEPLAEAADGERLWQLLSLSQNAASGELQGLLRLANRGDTTFAGDSFGVMLNGMNIGENIITSDLGPGQDCVLRFSYSNAVSPAGFHGLRLGGDRSVYEVFNLDWLLQRFGHTAVIDLEVLTGFGGSSKAAGRVVLTLREPLQLIPFEGEPVAQIPLLQGEVRASLIELLAGDNGVAMALLLTNATDEDFEVRLPEALVNGVPLPIDFPPDCLLPGRSQAAWGFCLIENEQLLPGDPLLSVELRLTLGYASCDPVVIRLPEGVSFGAPGGLNISADALETQPANFRRNPPLLPESVALAQPVSPPEALIAPVADERVGLIESGDAMICLYETDAGSGETASLSLRRVVGLPLQVEEGRLAGHPTGLALVVNGEPLGVVEDLAGDGYALWWNWDNLYAYSDADQFRPERDGPYSESLFDDLGENAYLALCLDLRTGAGGFEPETLSLRLNRRSWSTDRRDNRPLNEVALAVLERWVASTAGWTDADAPVGRYEYVPLSTDATLDFSLVPLESLGENLCVRYSLHYSDGDREEIVVDYRHPERVLVQARFH